MRTCKVRNWNISSRRQTNDGQGRRNPPCQDLKEWDMEENEIIRRMTFKPEQEMLVNDILHIK